MHAIRAFTERRFLFARFQPTHPDLYRFICRRHGLSPCVGQKCRRHLMQIVCAERCKLACISNAQTTGIRTRRMRVCPTKGVFPVFVYKTHTAWQPDTFVFHNQTSNTHHLSFPPHNLPFLHPEALNFSRLIKKVAEIFGSFKINIHICSVNPLPIAETYLKRGLTLLNEKASLMLCLLAY